MELEKDRLRNSWEEFDYDQQIAITREVGILQEKMDGIARQIAQRNVL